MTTQIIFRVWQASWIFDFFNDFLSKDSVWSSGSGNPIDSINPLGVALKNSSKVKTIVKTTLKLEIHEFEMSSDQNWFNYTQPLISGFWKSGTNLSYNLLIFDTVPICTQKKPK